jgi:hypothetical protein
MANQVRIYGTNPLEIVCNDVTWLQSLFKESSCKNQ